MTNLVDTGLGRPAIERETDKAYLMLIPNGVTSFHDRRVWVPKSQVTWHSDGVYHPTMRVPSWLARKMYRGY